METKHLKQDINIFDFLKSQNQSFSHSLLKGIQKMDITSPSYAQFEVLKRYMENGQNHLALKSAFHSGKTFLGALILAMELIKSAQNYIQSEEEKNGLFAVMLSSSKESALKNYLICEHLLKYSKKSHQIRTLNINQELSEIQLLPHYHYLLVGTPANFQKFSSKFQFQDSFYVGFVLDEFDYMETFGYHNDLDNFHIHFGQRIQNILLLITQCSENEELKALRKKLFSSSQTSQPSKLLQLFQAQQLEIDKQEELNDKTNIELIEVVPDTVNTNKKNQIATSKKNQHSKKNSQNFDQDNDDGVKEQNGLDEQSKQQQQQSDVDGDDNKEEKLQQQLNLQSYLQIQQYFQVGDSISKMIALYIMFKLHFLSGKTLILAKDIEEVYKLQIFLERIGVPHFQIYNHEDPKNLRYYVLSIFNTGVVNILVATNQILKDQKSKDFYDKKRKVMRFKNLDNIIISNLEQYKNDNNNSSSSINTNKNTNKSATKKQQRDSYEKLYSLFRGYQGTIVSLVDIHQSKEVDILSQIVEDQREQYGDSLNIKEFPLKKSEIDAFRYRITDVVNAISHRQVLNAKNLDFKRKLLKSKDMKEYFAKNVSERESMIEDIQRFSKQIKEHAVLCDMEVPDYLVPDIIKQFRKKNEAIQQEKKRILVQKVNNNYERSLKRRMEMNNLDSEKIKKIKKMEGDKYVTVDESKEQKDEVDPSRLKITSSKKLWKLKRGFKLKKRNYRLEKKGVFQ